MAQPDGARSEATRGSISRYRKIHGYGATRRVGHRRYRKAENLGQPSELVSRHRRRVRGSGRLETPSPVKPEMQAEGKPEAYIGSAAGGREETGQPGALRARQRGRMRESGRLEDSIAGTAKGRGRGAT